MMSNNTTSLKELFGDPCKIYYSKEPIPIPGHGEMQNKPFREIREEQFRKDVAETTSKLITEFTQDEQVSIAFVPLIFNHIAWIYAMKAVQKSVDYRVGILKKVTRAIRQLKQEYDREIAKDLDYRHQRHIEEQTERFVAEFHKDFTILYFSVNQEFKRKMPEWPYDDLRTYAIMSMLMIRFVDEHNRRMDRLIASRLGKSKDSVRMPVMDALHACMDAYAGEVGKFDYDDANVKLAMNVIANDMKKIEFDVL